MLWHIVRFRFPIGVDERERRDLEAALAALDRDIAEVAYLVVGRDIDDPQVTGLISGFDDEAGLAVYRDHPAHLPVVARARELCEEIQRLDVVVDTPPAGG